MDPFTYVAASIVGVLSVARTARLVVHDDFPPMAWLKRKVLLKWTPTSWVNVWECHFCLAPYLAAGMGAWAWASGLDTVWWVVNGWWAASYVAAVFVAYDQPEG